MKQTRIKAKHFNLELQKYGYEKHQFHVSKKDHIILIEDKVSNLQLILINKVVSFFYHEHKLVPTIKFLQIHPNLLKKVTVDMGAVKFVAGGANVMRPGITAIDLSIQNDEIVSIVDKNNQKVICLAKALAEASMIKAQQSGVALINVHFIGDKIWNFK
jgi:predicted RNA-binding protein (TIGR00451 family)